jgi:hypothetical protein
MGNLFGFPFFNLSKFRDSFRREVEEAYNTFGV